MRVLKPLKLHDRTQINQNCPQNGVILPYSMWRWKNRYTSRSVVRCAIFYVTKQHCITPMCECLYIYIYIYIYNMNLYFYKFTSVHLGLLLPSPFCFHLLPWTTPASMLMMMMPMSMPRKLLPLQLLPHIINILTIRIVLHLVILWETEEIAGLHG